MGDILKLVTLCTGFLVKVAATPETSIARLVLVVQLSFQLQMTIVLQGCPGFNGSAVMSGNEDLTSHQFSERQQCLSQLPEALHWR